MNALDTEADRAAMQQALTAIDQARRALEARLGGEVEAVDDEWPPAVVDLDDAYWEWMNLERAAAAGPYKATKLHSMRHDLSVKIEGRRWYSLRRIWQTRRPICSR